MLIIENDITLISLETPNLLEEFRLKIELARKKQVAESDSQEPPTRNKYLLYLAFGITAVGAVMALVPTILIFTPLYDEYFSWTAIWQLPLTYVLIAGVIMVTGGLILQRVITPPMKFDETEKLRSRLE